MAYKVLKPLPTNDGILPSGTIVDADGWRNLRSLVSGRYLAPVSDEDVVEPEPSKERKKALSKPRAAAVVDVLSEVTSVDQ